MTEIQTLHDALHARNTADNAVQASAAIIRQTIAGKLKEIPGFFGVDGLVVTDEELDQVAGTALMMAERQLIIRENPIQPQPTVDPQPGPPTPVLAESDPPAE